MLVDFLPVNFFHEIYKTEEPEQILIHLPGLMMPFTSLRMLNGFFRVLYGIMQLNAL